MKKTTFVALGCAMLMCVILAACNTGTQSAEHVHEWGEWTVTTEPTCTTEGEETRVCELDASHKEARSVAVNPDAHEWGEWKETKAPTCTAEGEETRICELNASHKETRSVAVNPDAHEWGEWKETKAPTCTAEGEETRVCELDASHKETRSVAADPDAHEWGEWKQTMAPTYVAEGEETRVCKYNAEHKQTRPLAKLEYITESLSVVNGESLTATYQVDKTLQLQVKIKYVYDDKEKDATRADVTYTSNNHAVATVSADGEVAIVAPGTAEITVESVYNNQSGAKVRKTIQLTVKHAPITEMTLTSSQSYSLIRGLADEAQGVTADATAQIALTVTYLGGTARAATNADVTFVSDNDAVASVGENGLITFNSVGTATIKITSKYEKQGGGYIEQEIAVTVNGLPENTTKLEITSCEIVIEKDGTYLKYTIKSTATSDILVMWLDVYFVDATGKVLGEHSIYVGTGSGSLRLIKPKEEIVIYESIQVVPEETAETVIYDRRTV